MIWLISSYFLFILATTSNAVMDNVNHHPSLSVLRRLWGGWWVADWTAKYNNGDPAQGRKTFYFLGRNWNVPVQIIDGWHFSKMAMVIFIVLSVSSGIVGGAYMRATLHPWYIVLYVLLLGITWNLVFKILYIRVLREKVTSK